MPERDFDLKQAFNFNLQRAAEAFAVPPLLRVSDLLGFKDVNLARSLSALEGRRVGNNQINNWKAGRAPIPPKHSAKLVALLEHALPHIKDYARKNEPAVSSVWSILKEADRIIDETLRDPKVAELVGAYRKVIKAIFSTPQGKRFEQDQERARLGKKGGQ